MTAPEIGDIGMFSAYSRNDNHYLIVDIEKKSMTCYVLLDLSSGKYYRYEQWYVTDCLRWKAVA